MSDREFIFALGMKSRAADSGSTLPIMKKEDIAA